MYSFSVFTEKLSKCIFCVYKDFSITFPAFIVINTFLLRPEQMSTQVKAMTKLKQNGNIDEV